MIDVQDPDNFGFFLVEYQVILKARDAPGPDTAQPPTSKFSNPAHAWINGKLAKCNVGCLNDTGCSVGIILSNIQPDRPKLILDTRIENDFIHAYAL